MSAALAALRDVSEEHTNRIRCVNRAEMAERFMVRGYAVTQLLEKGLVVSVEAPLLRSGRYYSRPRKGPLRSALRAALEYSQVPAFSAFRPRPGHCLILGGAQVVSRGPRSGGECTLDSAEHRLVLVANASRSAYASGRRRLVSTRA